MGVGLWDKRERFAPYRPMYIELKEGVFFKTSGVRVMQGPKADKKTCCIQARRQQIYEQIER